MRAIDYFDKQAEAVPDRIAIIDGGARYSYADVRSASMQIARAMWAAGLRGEEPVAIYSINDARVLLCMLGLMRAGAVWVPINYRNAPDANVEYLNYVKTSWLFYHSSYSDRVPELQVRVPTLTHLICIDTDGGKNPSLESFMQGGTNAEADEFASPEIEWADYRGNPDRLVGLVPTGGTTGPAKGVRVTSLSWGTMTEMASHYWRSESDRSRLPQRRPAFARSRSRRLHHVHSRRYQRNHAGLRRPRSPALYWTIPRDAFISSAHRLLRPARPSRSAQLRLLQPARVPAGRLTRFTGQAKARRRNFRPMPLPKLRPDRSAHAAHLPRPKNDCSRGRRRSSRTPQQLRQSHLRRAPGRSWTTTANSFRPANPAKSSRAARSSAPAITNMPEATAEIRAHGWHHTGDIGYRDEDGFFYIVDRKKDMIISGGFNVFSAEVEAAIMALPQVHECAVIGVPDPKWGEAVKALVVLRAGESLSEKDILDHCKTKLGGVKSPKSVEFVAEITKTPAGKIDRKQLRRPYWAASDRGVHYRKLLRLKL